MKTYSIWGDGCTSFTLVRGQKQPTYANGEPQPDCPSRLRVFRALNWKRAVKKFDKWLEG